MALDLLFPNFDELIRTPQDVQRLNEAILQLAVQGKLVAQDPEDEPASELLERIEAEKLRVLPRIDKEPFSLPNGWAWARLGSILEMEYGKGLPAKDRDDSGKIPVYGSNGIVGWHWGALVHQACVVIGRKGSSGAVNLSLEPCWVIDTAYFVVPPNDLDLTFVYRLFQSLHLEDLGKGIKPGLTRSEAYDLVLAIPPLAEQHRIVAKVDELFAQTCALEAKLRQAQADVVTANRAALHRLHTAQDEEQFQAAWRTIRDHFDVLYDDPRNVAGLRQAILDLAVRGKLVAQDPNDEPASELLKRIKEEKAKYLMKEHDNDDENSISNVRNPRPPFSLPDGWTWVYIGDVCFVRGGKRVPKGSSLIESPTDHIYIRVTDMKNGSIDDSDLRYVSDDVYEVIKQYTITKNDLYITIAGTIGKVGNVPPKFDGMNLTENAARLRFVLADRLFARYVLNSPLDFGIDITCRAP
jgi:type I restriction enzyme S subunit